MSPVIWSDRSLRDLRRAFDPYKIIDPGLALLIIDRIEAKTDILADFPSIGTPTEPGLRKLIVDRTPYIVLYRDDADAVRIVGIRHERQNWRPR